MGIPAPTELLLILGIALFIFGPKRIPEMMGGIAQGIKVFKKSMATDEIAPAEPPPPEITSGTKLPEPVEPRVEAK
jgi:sec-independent protein translocase protein TatA